MPDRKRLTPLETLVMSDVWEHAPTTVREVMERLKAEKPMAYTTVLTVMRVLRDKGFLQSERKGRSDSYSPSVTRDSMAQRTLSETLHSFFSGSSSALVSQLLETETIPPEELERMRREIDRRLAEEEDGR